MHSIAGFGRCDPPPIAAETSDPGCLRSFLQDSISRLVAAMPAFNGEMRRVHLAIIVQEGVNAWLSIEGVRSAYRPAPPHTLATFCNATAFMQ